MTFDSHLYNVLSVSARLVNALVPGERGGRPYPGPARSELVGQVADALGGDGRRRPRVTRAQAETLADTALSLREVFDLVDRGSTAKAARAVNTLMLLYGARPQLDPAGGGTFQLHFHGSDDSLSVGWSAGFAAGLAVVLGSDLAGRLGVCEAPSCDRVYVDSSRNEAKRFCSTGCQNRVKAAAFRVRHSSTEMAGSPP